MILLDKINERNFISKAYILTSLLFFIGIVFSKLMLSVSQFIFVALLLLEGNWKAKYIKLKQDLPALIFLSIYILFVVGLLWTENYKNGFHDLKIKLPILILPIVFLLTEKIHQKDIKIILALFSLAIFSKTMESIWIINNPLIENSIKNISHKISHIRYSLYLVFAIFSLFYMYINYVTKFYQKIFILFIILWFSFFIILLQSFTGIFIYIILIFYTIIYQVSKKLKRKVIIGLTFLLISGIIISFLYLNKQYKYFFSPKDEKYVNLELLTKNGNKYFHDTSNFLVENGFKVGYYQCEIELEKEWNKRSKINYDSTDLSGYKIKRTLKRFLSSKGYRKDSIGISRLTKQEILLIEKGVTNYKYSNPIKFSSRIYKTFWQLYVYSVTKNPNDQSITQRIEFLRTAFQIIKDNILIGVGTGDVKDSFSEQYTLNKTKLKEKYRLRAHNQIVTNILTLGFVLGLWILFAFIAPLFINLKHKELLPTTFFILIFLSMFTDDILETSISVGFLAFFYSLLILKK